MEEIRKVRITVNVETNKASYTDSFKDIDDARDYLEMILKQTGKEN